jgi:hypothetical protein
MLTELLFVVIHFQKRKVVPLQTIKAYKGRQHIVPLINLGTEVSSEPHVPAVLLAVPINRKVGGHQNHPGRCPCRHSNPGLFSP